MARRFVALLMMVGVAATALGILRAQSNSPAPEASSSIQIHREGTRLDQKAMTFRTENDRLLVQPDPDITIEVLENLAAQRIYRANLDDPENNRWTITGSFTEFEGRNFLLIEQATRIR